MDVRLVQLLGSFITARSEYALARLECAMYAPDIPAPPTIDRLTEPSEGALQAEWPAVERQLEAALSYVKHVERSNPRYRALDRSVREMDQYARAVRWVLTVTQNEDA